MTETIKKPNLQTKILNIGVKIGLLCILSYNSSNYLSMGYFHFLSLYGTFCFLTVCSIEYHRGNYILMNLAIVGIIVYQPIYSVLKIDASDGEVRTYSMIPVTTFLVVSYG